MSRRAVDQSPEDRFRRLIRRYRADLSDLQGLDTEQARRVRTAVRQAAARDAAVQMRAMAGFGPAMLLFFPELGGVMVAAFLILPNDRAPTLRAFATVAAVGSGLYYGLLIAIAPTVMRWLALWRANSDAAPTVSTPVPTSTRLERSVFLLGAVRGSDHVSRQARFAR
ncbi:hypothetical protein, partial [Catenulispora subtropica]|uniref:hypothetical protein n=1 Tax=Catenulispora subtropica TaxID=450798 RepID=UPI0031D5ABB9